MELKYFLNFIRANYPAIADESNEDLTQIGVDFKKYLEEIFIGKMDKLEPIWDISLKTVVMNKVKAVPFLMNGYHPALILHFNQFVEKMKNESE